MLRTSLITFFLLVAPPAPAQVTPDISARIASDGLAPTEAYLASLTNPDPASLFALGGVRFLRAIEVTLQTRWRLGINAQRTELPVLRLPVPANPAPEPFTPDAIETLFRGLIDDLTTARVPLQQIANADAVNLPIAILDLWFDINMNGIRDTGEGLTDVAGTALTGRAMRVSDTPLLQFDTADAAWLAAYTHFLSAFAELVLAFEPTDQIARVTEASRQMDDLAPDSAFPNALDMQFGQQTDRLAMIYFALRQQPDPAHTMAARDHMLNMIAANRVFWARVALETDNAGEWVPNDSQDQGLGLPVPPGTGTRWLAVLDDAEALLQGTRLIPHWRLREGAGINLKRLLENPVPVDLAEWAHGIGLLPFAEEGTRISRENWWAFERLMRGDSMLFVVFLN
jgi:hypothetical protein